jgi:DNA-directed RNA polymerase specialized sigma24 family protein
VREALRGTREPLGELLQRHWDTAVFLAAQVLRSSELARDAAQEAAIAAMTDLQRLRAQRLAQVAAPASVGGIRLVP